MFGHGSDMGVSRTHVWTWVGPMFGHRFGHGSDWFRDRGVRKVETLMLQDMDQTSSGYGI